MQILYFLVKVSEYIVHSEKTIINNILQNFNTNTTPFNAISHMIMSINDNEIGGREHDICIILKQI